MRGFVIAMAIGLLGLNVSAQQAEITGMSKEEAAKIASYPKLAVPGGYSFKSLPTMKDNSASEYFPTVFMQSGWSCNQASSVGYLFTYELNALRDLPASDPKNLYPPLYVWNFLNRGSAETGVSYFDSWEVIKTNGIPSVDAYGDNMGASRWPSGYDIYYDGMKNRTDEIFNLYVGDEAGLQTLKGWINDHLDGSPTGGLANFQIGSGKMRAVVIPDGLPEEGRYVMEHFHDIVGHAMTFVGWNDSVRHDFNGDGKYTNDLDITGDDVVDMKDWEVGAMLAVNSWGSDWPAMLERGRVYVPYRLLALPSDSSGIWEGLVTVVRPKKEYQPKLTIKASVTHTNRNQIKIVAGVARNFAAATPEFILEYPMFNFTGGSVAMQGHSSAGGETLEFGLDITPFLNYIDPNIPAKFFLEVYHRENDDLNGSGKIDYFSIMDYGSGSVIEEQSPDVNVGIRQREVVRAAVIYDPVSEPVRITTSEIPDANVGQGYSTVLQASGGTPPYKWSNMPDEYVAVQTDDEWEFPYAEQILGISDTSRLVIDLGFNFPFYDKEYSQVTVLKDGGIIMGSDPIVYPYVIDPRIYIYQNPGIYPFFTRLQYLFTTDGVYRFDDIDGSVMIAWDATLTNNTQVYDPKFGLKLFPDGRIETGYVSTSIQPDWNWIAGVSKGDMKSYTLPEINNNPIFYGGRKINYTLNDWPNWLYFSEGGALLGVAEDGDARVFLPVKVTDNSGLENYKTLNLHIHGTSSTDLLESDMSLELYPNPFTDRVNLMLDGVGDGIVRFTLYDAGGKKVLSRELPASAGNTSIDLSALEVRGTYFYQVEVEGGVFRGRLVKGK